MSVGALVVFLAVLGVVVEAQQTDEGPTVDLECSDRIAGTFTCFSSINISIPETIQVFCEDGCADMIRSVYTDCPDNDSLSNLELICPSGDGSCFSQLLVLQRECLSPPPQTLEEFSVFCSGECPQRLRDHFSTCPDENNVGLFNQGCTQGNAECLRTLQRLEPCFSFNLTNDTSTEEIRMFCQGDCPQNARNYFTACPDSENEGVVDIISERCAMFGFEITTMATTVGSTTVGDTISTSDGSTVYSVSLGVTSTLALIMIFMKG